MHRRPLRRSGPLASLLLLAACHGGGGGPVAASYPVDRSISSGGVQMDASGAIVNAVAIGEPFAAGSIGRAGAFAVRHGFTPPAVIGGGGLFHAPIVNQ